MTTQAAAKLAMVAIACSYGSGSIADDPGQKQSPSSAPEAPAASADASGPLAPMRRLAPNPARLTQAQTLNGAPPPAVARPAATAQAQGATAGTPKFVTQDKWLIAGYNNDEVIYQVFITNQDKQIIRCITEIHGSYIENGVKQSISDRQITTVFPNQPTQAGTWMDMDQQSGATYSVQCHPV
jgi:hypothetical protein